MNIKSIRSSIAAMLFVTAAITSWAQVSATRPLTIVVPAAPGGFIDATARLVGDSLAKLSGQTVIIDNKGGGSGNVAYVQVAHAPADGLTLLASYSGYHVGNPALTPKLPWSQADLVPIALLAVATNVITVHPAVPANDLQSFIAYLKAHPGQLTYASQGNGSVSHIGTEMFLAQTGTRMVHIPYRGSGPAMQDVLANQVQVFITTPPSVIGHVQAGRLRALAVAGTRRHPSLPGVPTADDAGLKGYEIEAWVALFAPAGTPAEVVNRLSSAVRQVLAQPQARTRADAAGVELKYLAPDALASLVRSDSAHWSAVIKAAGIKPD